MGVPEKIGSRDATPPIHAQKLKFSDGCYCIASAACAVQLSPDGSCRVVRLALGGVAPVPVRLSQVETMLAGGRLTEKLMTEVEVAAQGAVTNPITDVLADGEYRRAMAGVMARRALAAAFRHARQEKC